MLKRNLTGAYKNKYKQVIIVAILVCLFAAFVSYLLQPGPNPVQLGSSNFSKFDFKKNGTVRLNGDWEFYWNKLLYHEDFISPNPPVPDTFFHVPGSWVEIKAGDKNYPDMGYGTYRSTIIIPQSMQEPALLIRNIVNAYMLYANGELIAQLGTVSKDATGFNSDFKHITALLPKGEKEIELIIQVANFDYTKGGIRDGIILGELKDIQNKKTINLLLQLLCMGFVIALGLFYVMVFILRRKNPGALFFGLLCIVIALRTSVWGEIPFEVFSPGNPLKMGLFINYITGFNIIPLMALFLMYFYPYEFKKKTTLIILIPALSFNLLLFMSPVFISRFNTIIYINLCLYVVYIIVMLAWAAVNKRKNAMLLLISAMVFFSTVAIELFLVIGRGKIDLSFATLFGNIVLVSAMSYIQLRQQADTQKSLEELNIKLVEADKLKDKIMSTETAFLQAQMKPHFLFNALSAISNISQKDGKKGSNLIVDLAMYLRRSFDFQNIDTVSTVETELDYVRNYVNIEKARFGKKIAYEQQIAVPENTPMPIFVLQPLVENAIRHGISKKESGGLVSLHVTEDAEKIYVEVKDNGIGMNEEKLSSLFIEKVGSVGLLNINSRLLRLYGKGLDIKSEPDSGTIVSFEIPKEEAK